jgi:hypothetical protein
VVIRIMKVVIHVWLSLVGPFLSQPNQGELDYDKV